MRTVCPEAIDLIKKWETLKLHPYICPAGWWTIGYGAVHDPSGRPVCATTPPLPDERVALAMLARDVNIAGAAVLRYITVPLNDWQYGALVSWTFNLGAARLQESTMRQVLLREEYEDVPPQMIRWVYGKDPKTGLMVKLNGLVSRRKEESQLFQRVDPSVNVAARIPVQHPIPGQEDPSRSSNNVSDLLQDGKPFWTAEG